MSNSALTKEQYNVAKQIVLRMTCHINMAKSGHLQHEAMYKGIRITRIITTPKRNGVWGNGVAKFYINEEDTEYDLVGLLNELIKR